MTYSPLTAWLISARLRCEHDECIDVERNFDGDLKADGYSYDDAVSHFHSGYSVEEYARIVAKRVALIEQAKLEAERE